MKKVLGLLIALLLLVPGLAMAETLSVKANKCNFRKGPSTKDPVAFTADKFYPVKVVERKAGWVRVTDFEGEKAWVLGEMLSKEKSVVIKADKTNVKAKADPKSKTIFTAGKGAAFKVVKSQGKWLLIQHSDGDRGWVLKDATWGL
jgi:SH3-like domain-containing protein